MLLKEIEKSIESARIRMNLFWITVTVQVNKAH